MVLMFHCSTLTLSKFISGNMALSLLMLSEESLGSHLLLLRMVLVHGIFAMAYHEM
jgi:hypothetical protein